MIRRLQIVTAVIVVAIAIEPSRVGLISSGSTDYAGWSVFVLLSTPGGLALLLSPRVRAALVQAPALPLTLALAWIVFVSPLGMLGINDVVVAVALACVFIAGVWLGASLGWPTTRLAAARGLAIVLPLGLAMQPVLGGGAGDGRIQGLSAHPNEFGMAAALGVILAVGILSQHRRTALLLLAVGPVCIVVSDSRTAALAASVGLIVAARPLIGRAAPGLAVIGAVFAAAGIVVSGAGDVVGDAVARSGDAQEIVTVTGRTTLWNLSLDLINAKPLTGVGADSTTVALEPALESGRLNWFATSGHNAFLQFALSGGWPAAIAFLAFPFTYWAAARGRPSAGRDAIVVAIMINGLTESVMREPGLAWFVLALAIGSAVSVARSPTAFRSSDDQPLSGSNSISPSSSSTSLQPSISASAS